MAVTMYSGFVPVCLQLLGGLKTVLQKAEEHATAQKWDTTVVLNLRLFPDMFPLERQVRQVCTHSCGAGRVAGISLPSLADHDNSFAEMQARIDKTIDFLKGLRADQLDGKEETVISPDGWPAAGVQVSELPVPFRDVAGAVPRYDGVRHHPQHRRQPR
jgi:hypothetical protein